MNSGLAEVAEDAAQPQGDLADSGWWDEIIDSDQEHLLGPPKVDFDTHPGFDDRAKYLEWNADRKQWLDWLNKRHPPKCFFCGGRTRHNPACCTLQWPFEVTMPWGAHRGKRLADVPEDYLQWLVRKSDRMDDKLREAIELVLKRKRQPV